MIDTHVIGLPIDVITLGTWWPGLDIDFEAQVTAYTSTADTLAFAGQSVTAIAGRAGGADSLALVLDANEIVSLLLALPGTVNLLNTGATATASTMQTVVGLSNNGGGAVLQDIVRAA